MSRAEGPIELGPSGLQATLAALSTLASSEDLTLEDKGEALAEVLYPASLEYRSFTSPFTYGAKRLDRLVTTDARVPPTFRQDVIAKFVADGWEIEQAGVPEHQGFDFKARRGPELRVVEVTPRRFLGTADVDRILGRLVPAAKDANGIAELAVPEGGVTTAARKKLADTGVRLLQFPSAGA
jgi:hypothetical protein